jgi:hypothetical protein
MRNWRSRTRTGVRLGDERLLRYQGRAAAIIALAKDSAKRSDMGAAMRGLARPQAAQAIVDRLEALARKPAGQPLS